MVDQGPDEPESGPVTRRNRRVMVPELIKRAALELGPLTNAYQVQARIKNELPYMTPEITTISQHLVHGGYARKTGRMVPIEICAPENRSSTRQLVHRREVCEFEILEASAHV